MPTTATPTTASPTVASPTVASPTAAAPTAASPTAASPTCVSIPLLCDEIELWFNSAASCTGSIRDQHECDGLRELHPHAGCDPTALPPAAPQGQHRRALGMGSTSSACTALYPSNGGSTPYINHEAVSVWDVSAATEDVTPCDPATHPEGTPCGYGHYSYYDYENHGNLLLEGEAQGYCSYGASSECGDMDYTRIPYAYRSRSQNGRSVSQMSSDLIALGASTSCYIADKCTANHCDNGQADRDSMARVSPTTPSPTPSPTMDVVGTEAPSEAPTTEPPTAERCANIPMTCAKIAQWYAMSACADPSSPSDENECEGLRTLHGLVPGCDALPSTEAPTEAPTEVPTASPTTSTSELCLTDALQCSDGSYVSRVPPGCDFADCPELGCDSLTGRGLAARACAPACCLLLERRALRAACSSSLPPSSPPPLGEVLLLFFTPPTRSASAGRADARFRPAPKWCSQLPTTVEGGCTAWFHKNPNANQNPYKLCLEPASGNKCASSEAFNCDMADPTTASPTASTPSPTSVCHGLK